MYVYIQSEKVLIKWFQLKEGPNWLRTFVCLILAQLRAARLMSDLYIPSSMLSILVYTKSDIMCRPTYAYS